MPWGLPLERGGAPRHPVEIYAALLLLAGAALLYWWKRQRHQAGIVAVGAIAIGAGSRLATEPFRLSLGAGPMWWYAVAAVAALVLLTAITATRAAPEPN